MINLHKKPETVFDYMLPPIIGVSVVLILSTIFLVNIAVDAKNAQDRALANLDDVKKELRVAKAGYDSLEYYSQLKDPRTIWLARAIYSETDKASEMWHVGWVIRNRVEIGYNGKTTYRDVILDRKQFSAFNYGRRYRDYYLTKSFHEMFDSTQEAKIWRYALENARRVVFADSSDRPFDPKTLYYYSEISMPDWKKHPEWAQYYDQVKVESIDEYRFRFFADYDYKGGTPETIHNYDSYVATTDE